MYVTVSSKGQIVIPSIIRKKLGIRKGEKLVVCVEKDRIIIEPVEKMVKKGRGLLKKEGSKVLKHLLEERKKEEEREEIRF